MKRILVMALGIILLSPPAMAQDPALDAWRAGNYEKAAELWRGLAATGNATARFNLAGLYQTGQGVARDSAMAAQLYRLSADQGHATAQLDLAILYAAGTGVGRDLREAYRWAEKALAGLREAPLRAAARQVMEYATAHLADPRAPALPAPEGTAPATANPQPAPAAPTLAVAPPPTAVPTPARAGWRLQLAAYLARPVAERGWRALSKKYGDILGGLEPATEAVDIAGRGTVYRLQAGPFASRAGAAEKCAELKAAGGECLVVRAPAAGR